MNPLAIRWRPDFRFFCSPAKREETVEREKISKKPVQETSFPVLEEELQIGKRIVETGITRVSIHVTGSEELIEQPLMREKVEVQHVEINRFIDRPAETRTEGEVTIIPVMEEVLVVEKKLRLKEELHITRHREMVTHSEKEKVRKEEVVIEHTDLPR